MRVGVVGAGLYGCVSAVALARDGHDVVLLDQLPDLMAGASAANQGRVHRGFHYPRSAETVQECRQAAPAFEARFAPAIDRSRSHYYAVAQEGSLTTAGAFLDRCEEITRFFRQTPPWLRNVDAAVRVDEAFVNLETLRRLLWSELAVARVRVALEQELTWGQSSWLFDQVVRTTYGDGWPRPLQREVVEVALMELPIQDRLRDVSLVVLDGSFCSVDPTPDGRHMVYDVRHSVHACSVGREVVIPDHLAGLVNRGLARPEGSRWREIRDSAARFMPALERARYVGSLFTLRAVLPGQEATDARPWSVEGGERLNVTPLGGEEQFVRGPIHVLPGKLASCLAAAEEVVRLCRA